VRTYGRISTSSNSPGPWTVVQTDAQGNDDYVWLTTLIQCLLLNYGESPFFATYGIPAGQSLVQQVSPDYYVTWTQQRFASHFAALLISRQQFPYSAYRVNVTTNQGVKIQATVAI
jgi:hypothetical protein